MITAAPGASFETSALFVAGISAGTVGVRILDGAGATTTARATLTALGGGEFPASSGIYYATVTAPSTAGDYIVLWDNGATTPGNVVAYDLHVSYTSPATSTPSGSDLCTVADVRTQLETPTGETSRDTLIQVLITHASASIQREIRREFAPVTTAATRRRLVWPGRRATGSVLVDLDPYDLRTVSSMTLHPEDTSPVTLVANTDYILDPVEAVQGTYQRVLIYGGLSFSSTLSQRFGFCFLDVAGAWGFSSVPDDVKQACIEAVCSWLRRDMSAVYDVDDPRQAQPDRLKTLMLPPSSRQKLAPFRRSGGAY